MQFVVRPAASAGRVSVLFVVWLAVILRVSAMLSDKLSRCKRVNNICDYSEMVLPMPACFVSSIKRNPVPLYFAANYGHS